MDELRAKYALLVSKRSKRVQRERFNLNRAAPFVASRPGNEFKTYPASQVLQPV